MILYALLSGCLPFEDESVRALYDKICKGAYSYPSYFSQGVLPALSATATYGRPVTDFCAFFCLFVSSGAAVPSLNATKHGRELVGVGRGLAPRSPARIATWPGLSRLQARPCFGITNALVPAFFPSPFDHLQGAGTSSAAC